jgi:hypothetical protein
VPKSFPMMVLTKDPLAACVGGGGTTVDDADWSRPLSTRRNSRASAEGGGATTDGAGILSLAMRSESRSGADTGGGTTATLFISAREGETSRCTVVGAGAITLPLSAGAERICSAETRVDAGAMTVELSAGAERLRSRDRLMFGAGPMMLASSFGAYSVCSDCTLGAGGTIAELSAGADREWFDETFGAGGTMEVKVKPPRDCSRGTSPGGAITFAGRFGELREECRPSADDSPGIGLTDLNLSRFATAPLETGSLRLGASTTCCASAAPRATWMVWVR